MGFIEISQELMGLAETYWDLMGFASPQMLFVGINPGIPSIKPRQPRRISNQRGGMPWPSNMV